MTYFPSLLDDMSRRPEKNNKVAVNAQLINAFVFATRIVQSVFFVNANIKISGLLL